MRRGFPLQNVGSHTNTAGNDKFKGRGVTGELTGTKFRNRVKRVEKVTAFSTKGTDKLDIADLKYDFTSIGPWIEV